MVAFRIVGYAYVMVATSLLLWPVADMGWLYVAVAAVLGVAFIVEAHLLLKRSRSSDDPVRLAPMRLFHASNAYLALLFAAVALDTLVR